VIYVALSELKKMGIIESYKYDPKMNGSYFKIKTPINGFKDILSLIGEIVKGHRKN